MQGPEDKPDTTYIHFHLHGGTTYGRGITTLPEAHTDAKQLKAWVDNTENSSGLEKEWGLETPLDHGAMSSSSSPVIGLGTV